MSSEKISPSSNKVVVYNPSYKENIKDSFAAMAALATKKQCVVMMTFNTKTFHASPGADAKQLYRDYQEAERREMEARKKSLSEQNAQGIQSPWQIEKAQQKERGKTQATSLMKQLDQILQGNDQPKKLLAFFYIGIHGEAMFDAQQIKNIAAKLHVHGFSQEANKIIEKSHGYDAEQDEKNQCSEDERSGHFKTFITKLREEPESVRLAYLVGYIQHMISLEDNTSMPAFEKTALLMGFLPARSILGAFKDLGKELYGEYQKSFILAQQETASTSPPPTTGVARMFERLDLSNQARAQQSRIYDIY